jgi:hypothetical protein
VRADIVGQMKWRDLLGAGSRLFYEAQLAPVLALDGRLDEIMIDVACADGRRLPALLNAESIRDTERRLIGTRIALMTVPDRREYEETLRRAREQAEAASLASARTQGRLELLTAANTALASSVDVEVALRRLAWTLVRNVADWCVIFALDSTQSDSPQIWSAAHVDPQREPEVSRVAELLPLHTSRKSALSGRGEAVLLPEITPEYLHRSTTSGELLDLYAGLQMGSAIVVPSRARGQRVAVMILVRDGGRTPFTDQDLSDLSDLGARTGIVIDNLHRYAIEHSNSVALQHALLTAPPDIPGFDLVTRYLPASGEAEVGGDWYDAFAQPGGGVALVIGDVVGHDIHAAAAMGQLRGVIRTVANAMPGTPAAVLSRADRTADGLQVAVIASAVLAQIEAESSGADGGRIMLWSNAGHPPPLLITSDGETRLLEQPSDPLLGVIIDVERHDYSIELHPGDTLLLYTDGLIEDPAESIDDGLARLVSALTGGQRMSLDALCDAVLARHGAARRDDIALLALRVTRSAE